MSAFSQFQGQMQPGMLPPWMDAIAQQQGFFNQPGDPSTDQAQAPAGPAQPNYGYAPANNMNYSQMGPYNTMAQDMSNQQIGQFGMQPGRPFMYSGAQSPMGGMGYGQHGGYGGSMGGMGGMGYGGQRPYSGGMGGWGMGGGGYSPYGGMGGYGGGMGSYGGGMPYGNQYQASPWGGSPGGQSNYRVRK